MSLHQRALQKFLFFLLPPLNFFDSHLDAIFAERIHSLLILLFGQNCIFFFFFFGNGKYILCLTSKLYMHSKNDFALSLHICFVQVWTGHTEPKYTVEEYIYRVCWFLSLICLKVAMLRMRPISAGFVQASPGFLVWSPAFLFFFSKNSGREREPSLPPPPSSPLSPTFPLPLAISLGQPISISNMWN